MELLSITLEIYKVSGTMAFIIVGIAFLLTFAFSAYHNQTEDLYDVLPVFGVAFLTVFLVFTILTMSSAITAIEKGDVKESELRTTLIEKYSQCDTLTTINHE